MLVLDGQVLHSGDLICEGMIKMLAEPAKTEEPKKEEAAPAAPAAEVGALSNLCFYQLVASYDHIRATGLFNGGWEEAVMGTAKSP